MKKITIGGESRFQRFINGRGFYAVLAVCLLAVGGVAAALVSRGLTGDQDPAVSEPPLSDAAPVEQVVTNQPDDRTTTATQAPATTATTQAATADLYVLPFGNLVQKVYSDGAPAYSVTMNDWRVHNGADYEGEIGESVRAIADGTVLAVENDPLWGTVVRIDHGLDVISTYCGVKSALAVGTNVKVGQTIGTLEEIPCESAQKPHLHLELTVDGKTADPVTAIGLDVRYAEDEITQ